MPKIKDFIKPVNVIVTAFNPVAGAVLSMVQLLLKKKEKVMIKLEGKKTYIGILITVLAFIAQILGYDIDIHSQNDLSTSLAQISQAIGILITTYGRIKANKK